MLAGTDGLRKTGAGTLVLGGTNTYSGGTEIDAGVLSVSADFNLGNLTGGLTLDGGTLGNTAAMTSARNVTLNAGGGTFQADTLLSIGGVISGDGSLTKTGAGTLMLTGSNDYTGGTTVSDGVLQIGNFSETGSITGAVAVDAGGTFWVVNGSTDGITSIANSGTTSFFVGTSAGNAEISNLGTLSFIGAATGGSAAITNGADGIVDFVSAVGPHGDRKPSVGSIAGAGHLYLGDNELTIGGNNDSAIFSGIITDDRPSGSGSSGSLAKIGSGTLTLNGVNTYTGLTTINDGKLVVGDDSHASASLAGGVIVNTGGTLGGIGTVGATTIMAGGIHAPGNSPGTQTINGDYANYGTLAIDVTPTLSDKLIVNGSVDITGATLDLLLSPTSAADWNITNGPFTIIANDGADAVTGTFDPVTKNLLFLDTLLDYAGGDGNDVTLKLNRNDVDFADVAQTRNQKATADGIDSLSNSSPIWAAIALQSDEDATRAAFDQLSGEIHASVKSGLIEDSHFVRDAVNDRIRSAFGDATGADMPLLAYGEGGPRATTADSIGAVAWGYAFGSWGSFDGDGNATAMDTSTGGFLTGIDGEVASNVRLGLLAGYSHSSFDIDDRASSGSSDNYHLGLYAGGKWDALRLTGGLAYTWHDIGTNRSVAFPGFSDSLKGNYNAGTFQAFGEAGYKIDAGAVSFEPFANLAYVSLHTDGFTEQGGAAALHVRSATTDATFTTLGAHVSSAFDLGTMTAIAHGTLGWRHAFGNITPFSTHTFAGGDAFDIAGVPIAKDAALVEAGFDLDITEAATLGIAYQGQFGNGTTQNGFNARLQVTF